MSKITRMFQKLFGEDGPTGDFGIFGSKAAAAPANSKDPDNIQSLAAFKNGWASAVVGGATPCLEDMNSLFYLLFRQVAYILQQGIAEYNASTTYYTGSLVNVAGVIYVSLGDANINHPPASSPTYWTLFKPSDLAILNQAAGDLIWFDGTNWVRVPKGSANQILQCNGTSIPTWVNKPAGGSFGTVETGKTLNTVYQAGSDGFLLVNGNSTGAASGVEVFSDASLNPTTRVASFVGGTNVYTSGNREVLTVPIKKDMYYKVTSTGSGNLIEDYQFWPLA